MKHKKLSLRIASSFMVLSLLLGVVSGCTMNTEVLEAGFQEGWDAAVSFLGSEAAAASTADYISQVQAAIDSLSESINARMGSNQGIPQEAGFIAEQWHAGTFNIDAALNGSIYSADAVGSTALGSSDVDVIGPNGEIVTQSSLKYYNTASGSANAQAITVLERYGEYVRNSTSESPLSFQEYCEQNGYDTDVSALYSIYDGQIRIIPSDQLDGAIAYLQGRADLPNTAYAETLANLKDRLEAPDGSAASTPATYEQMQMVAELAQSGEFEPEQFGISTAQLITPKYVVKQAVNGGLTTAAYELVLSIGPDLFSVVRESVRTGKIDINQLRDIGIDGLFASSVGFVEGATSSLILSACQTGKLGPGLTNVTPETVGAIVVIAKQAIRYGYALYQGEITALEYGDLMAENVVVIVCSNVAGAALQAYLPALPFAYAMGSIVGGMLATVGYRILRDAVTAVFLFFGGAGGFEAAVPLTEEIDDIAYLPTEELSQASVYMEKSSAEDISINLGSDGAVALGLDAEYYCPNCGAVLNDMEGFDPALGFCYCEECGMLLYGDDVYPGERFPDIIWFCDNCDDCLSMQDGFNDLEDTWVCTECGYENSITEDSIW